MTRMQALMVEDGLPASLLLTPEQRRALWEACPPRPMPLFQDRTRDSEDAATTAFRAQVEEERRQKSRAQIDRMKNRFASKAIDHSKMRWDQRRNKFVEDRYVSAPNQGVARPGNVLPRHEPTTKTVAHIETKIVSSGAAETVAAKGSPDWSLVTKDTARALAELNGVWDDKYAKLSGGLLVMTVSNKLKGLAKKGEQVRWVK